MPVTTRAIVAPDAPPPPSRYAQAFEVAGASRLLFVSGQIPVSTTGEVPTEFGAQCRLCWRNIEAQLRAANMTLANIVKVTIFLSDRRYSAENREIRQAVLGEHRPALTAIITGIFDEAWLLEIEAVAAA
jgi:enamine deaminase RidA (YjgF/YER057c/UK114 family)